MGKWRFQSPNPIVGYTVFLTCAYSVTPRRCASASTSATAACRAAAFFLTSKVLGTVRLGKDRRRAMPDGIGLGVLIAILEQRTHIRSVEVLLVREVEIRPNVGELVIDAVALAGEVDANDVVVAAVVDHGVDRPTEDAQQTTIH